MFRFTLGVAGAILGLCVLMTTAANAACVGVSGQSINGRAFSGTIGIGPNRIVTNRFFRLTPGRHTIQAMITAESDINSGCRGDNRGLEYTSFVAPGGRTINCRSDDEEGPARKLSCRITVSAKGSYYIHIKNPGCREIEYSLICRNGHVAHY